MYIYIYIHACMYVCMCVYCILKCNITTFMCPVKTMSLFCNNTNVGLTVRVSILTDAAAAAGWNDKRAAPTGGVL